MPELQDPLARACGVGTDRFFIVCGGWFMEARLDAFAFDPKAMSWTKIASMHHQRAGAAAASLTGKVYVVGGWDGEDSLTSVERFDTHTGRWEKMPPLDKALRGAAAVTVHKTDSLPSPRSEDFSPTRRRAQTMPATF